jgi:putative intracellular protease/amidase
MIMHQQLQFPTTRFAGKLAILLTLLFSFILSFYSANAQPMRDQQEIEAVIEDYIMGSSYNQEERLRRAFHANARLYLSQPDGGMREIDANTYIGWFSRNPGQFSGRIGRLLSVEISNDIATAKAEILAAKDQARFVDLFLLKKLDNRWQIITKTATRETAKAHGRKVLIVVSNASVMPGSKLSAGNGFAQLIHAYEALRVAGYGVQFISPEGGAVPLAYLDTQDAEHKTYVYDRDFMWGLANTRKPDQIRAADYEAMVYIGGSAAMYGVADDPAMKALAANIYEKQSGVLGAVCHGAAGLVDLKLSDGSSLLRGKRVTGYPDAFENMNAPYYKTFPFSIEQKMKSNEAQFSYGARNQSHVEVDGRLVTGTNWQSTRGMMAAIIKQLDEQAEMAKPEK